VGSALLQILLNELEAILAPEELPLLEIARNAEHVAIERLLGVGDVLVLDGLGLSHVEDYILVQPDSIGNLARVVQSAIFLSLTQQAGRMASEMAQASA
jgi:hypothetical protein